MAEPIEMSIGGGGARNHVLNVVPDPPTTITASFEKKVIFVEAHACRWSIYSTLFARSSRDISVCQNTVENSWIIFTGNFYKGALGRHT